MMQSVLGNSSKVLVDQKAGSNLLYLPLDKLIQQSGAPAPGRAGAAPTPAAARSRRRRRPKPPVTLDPRRSRDALRSRDRGGDTR